MFRLASTKVTTPVNESAQVLLAERSCCAKISATVVNAELPALHGQTMADRIRIIVRKRSISIIVLPIYPFLQGKLHPRSATKSQTRSPAEFPTPGFANEARTRATRRKKIGRFMGQAGKTEEGRLGLVRVLVKILSAEGIMVSNRVRRIFMFCG
jgi:hypothetical protein